MSKKSDMLHESQFVNLPDEDLKEALGYLWNRVKSLKEAEKTDKTAQELQAKYKDYVAANFGDERKKLEKKLKAARFIASTRGIRWKEPFNA